MTQTSPALSAQNISLKIAGRQILRAQTLHFAQEKISVLCGRNGAGKTSLLRVLAGELTPNAGTLTQHLTPVVFVADKPALYGSWRVETLLAWFAGVCNATKAQVQKAIAACQLESVLLQRCGALSQGYRQRVSLALALLESPRCLLLDEPFNGLDSAQKETFAEVLKALSAHAAIILSHHNYQDVAALADALYFLADGQCREIKLPAKTPALWAEWESELVAQQVPADAHYGAFTQHFYASQAAEKSLFSRLAARAGICALGRAMPSGVIAYLLGKI